MKSLQDSRQVSKRCHIPQIKYEECNITEKKKLLLEIPMLHLKIIQLQKLIDIKNREIDEVKKMTVNLIKK
mgnify:CR=1 FL=1